MRRGTLARGAAGLLVMALLAGCTGVRPSPAAPAAPSAPAASSSAIAGGPAGTAAAGAVLHGGPPPRTGTPAPPVPTPAAAASPATPRRDLGVFPPVAGGGAAGTSTVGRAPAATGGSPPPRPAQPRPSASGNWSGYVASGSFTDVSGSWAEPVTRCSSPDSTVAFWVGLGGAPGYPLAQAGSGVLCRSGVALHVLWYEVVTGPGPQSQVAVLQISAGDRVAAEVDLGSGASTGVIRLMDVTTGGSVSVGISPGISSSDSAEWIAEATTATATGAVAQLADFGEVTFQDCSLDHGQEGLAGWPGRQLTALTLEDADGGTAGPGPVTAESPAVTGGMFTVTFGA